MLQARSELDEELFTDEEEVDCELVEVDDSDRLDELDALDSLAATELEVDEEVDWLDFSELELLLDDSDWPNELCD